MFRFVGNGFLYNMVRILVVLSWRLEQGEEIQMIFRRLLAKKDRRLTGKTAPAHGLLFMEIFY